MNVIKIASGSKYVLQFDHKMSEEERGAITKSLADWWKSNNPFLLIGSNIKLVKVDKEDNDGNNLG